jgi:hypothetical protein
MKRFPEQELPSPQSAMKLCPRATQKGESKKYIKLIFILKDYVQLKKT